MAVEGRESNWQPRRHQGAECTSGTSGIEQLCPAEYVSSSDWKKATLPVIGNVMSSLPRQLVYSFCIFTGVAIGPFLAMSLLTREPIFDDPLSWALALLDVLIGTLLCVGICRTLDRIPGTLVGAVIGLIIPPCVAWIEGQIAMSISRHWWTARVPDALSLWIGGLIAAVPSGIAGAIVGFLQSGSSDHS